MLRRGVYFHPDGTERMMITAAHGDIDVESILSAAEDSFRELKGPD
jgi:glutamate-1-semialdehyde aminotransferase